MIQTSRQSAKSGVSASRAMVSAKFCIKEHESVRDGRVLAAENSHRSGARDSPVHRGAVDHKGYAKKAECENYINRSTPHTGDRIKIDNEVEECACNQNGARDNPPNRNIPLVHPRFDGPIW